MQSINNRSSSFVMDLMPVLGGVALTASATGVALALTGSDSPLRAPFVIFFLFAGPAAGLLALLAGLDRASRAAIATAGAVAVNLVVAWARSSGGPLTTSGGILAVTAVTALLFLWAAARRRTRTPAGDPPAGARRTARSDRDAKRSSKRTTEPHSRF
ncbi:hypothetical protein [Streptomyces sp. CAU 1734]|uniref:hypothetical protein n=1 Tax=Streptomyces sp. CAU 1734 TaxID=3140360 RepID=UPI003260DF00